MRRHVRTTGETPPIRSVFPRSCSKRSCRTSIGGPSVDTGGSAPLEGRSRCVAATGLGTGIPRAAVVAGGTKPLVAPG